MRSYRYHDGTWQRIDDPLPTVRIDSERNPDVADFHFVLALEPFGFHALGCTDVESRLGSFTVYARDHQVLKAQRQTEEFPYDFVCPLKIGRLAIRVWVADLPTLFLFLAEVGARPEQKYSVKPPEREA